MQIFLVMYQFNHHYKVSGYNRLADFVPCKKIVVPRPISFLLEKLATQRRREILVETTGLTGYFPECLWLERQVTRKLRQTNNSIFHFIYPENSYYYSSLVSRSKQTKVIATYHQPVQESKQFIRKTDAIRKLDGVILMSESQREFFEPLVSQERIFVVHHGIDTTFFIPSSEPRTERRIIAVGNWLRDFTTLVNALKILHERQPDVVCDVVTLENNRMLFSGLKNVKFHAHISDAELLKLYQSASLSVLSLSNTAANNALLESLACGLPLVATDLPAVREYTQPQGCRYVEAGNAEHLAESIAALLDDEQELLKMGRFNREHALRFSWETVAHQTMDVYTTIRTM